MESKGLGVGVGGWRSQESACCACRKTSTRTPRATQNGVQQQSQEIKSSCDKMGGRDRRTPRNSRAGEPGIGFREQPRDLISDTVKQKTYTQGCPLTRTCSSTHIQ